MTDLVARFEAYRLDLEKFSTATVDGKERQALKKQLLQKRDRLYNDVSTIQQRKGSMDSSSSSSNPAPRYIMTAETKEKDQLQQQKNEVCWDVADKGAEDALWKSLGYKGKQKRAWSLPFWVYISYIMIYHAQK